MVVSVQVLGVANIINLLEHSSEETKQKVEEGIKQAGFFIEGEVKASIAGQRAEIKSVDTGRFLNSVKTLFPKKMEAVVESDVEYAKSLEFGTSRMNARHHFGNTIKRNEKKVNNFIEGKIK